MATLEKVMQEVQALAPDERRRLREALDALSNETAKKNERQKEEALLARMKSEGFIVEIPWPVPARALPFEDYVPIEVQGKPVSETIIEERR